MFLPVNCRHEESPAVLLIVTFKHTESWEPTLCDVTKGAAISYTLVATVPPDVSPLTNFANGIGL